MCVCEDSVVRVWLGVCRQASESEWDRLRLKSVAVCVQKCAFPTSERTISRWPFWVGWQTHTHTHTRTRVCKYTRHPLALNMWCNQQPYRGSCGAVTGSLTSPWAFFREGIGQDEWATLVFTPFQSICDFCSKWLCVHVGVMLIFILAHSPLCFCAYSTISGPSVLPIA